MNDEEFVRLQSWVYLFAKLVVDTKLEEFIEACDRADTIGAFMDPTLYREKGRDLQRVRNLASALVPFKREADKVKAEVMAR